MWQLEQIWEFLTFCLVVPTVFIPFRVEFVSVVEVVSVEVVSVEVISVEVVSVEVVSVLVIGFDFCLLVLAIFLFLLQCFLR